MHDFSAEWRCDFGAFSSAVRRDLAVAGLPTVTPCCATQVANCETSAASLAEDVGVVVALLLGEPDEHAVSAAIANRVEPAAAAQRN